MRTIKPIIRREMPHEELNQRLDISQKTHRALRLQHLIVRDFDFNGLALRRPEIYDTLIDRCRFRDCALAGVLIGESQAVSTDFQGAVGEDADIVWSVLRNSSFEDARLRRAYFYKSDFSLVSFRNADLKGASFVQCDLSFADFNGAKLDSVEFADCFVHGVKGLGEKHLLYEPALFSQKHW